MKFLQRIKHLVNRKLLQLSKAGLLLQVFGQPPLLRGEG